MIDKSDSTYTDVEAMLNDIVIRYPKWRMFIDNNFHCLSCGGSNASYSITHPWKYFEELFRQLKYAWQRVFRFWDDRVIWSIDWYLAKYIPIWMQELKIKKHGVPSEMFEGLPVIDDNYNYSEESWKIAQDRYDNILDNITDGFESYLLLEEYYGDDDEYRKTLRDSFNNGFDLFKKWFGTFWD